MQLEEFLNRVRGRLIVSCQALHGTPMDDPYVIRAVAQSVELAGACALRINGPENVRAVRQACSVPIVGINKTEDRTQVYITPTFDLAAQVAAAGADVVAVQATEPRRGKCDPLDELVNRIHAEFGLPVVADVSNVAEGEAAIAAGADIVASTLAGYVGNGQCSDGPDVQLVRELAALGRPVIAEGKYHTPQQVLRALDAGATSVVVGTAITMPDRITRWFVNALDAR
jgi:N-acylglucosamine-6-phosphate 2-epimerase